MTDLLLLGLVLGVAASAAALWRRREGRAVTVDDALGDGVRERVGVPSGKPTLLLFTTPTCRNCAAARTVIDAVAADSADVAVAEVDVATHTELAREHRVLRAPTILVVDADDGIRARVSGVPEEEGLREALAG
jgi:thioredoxin-like negative regulator of GroEL